VENTLDLLNNHSFITEIYVAPLQGYCLEVLPALALLKEQYKTRRGCVRMNLGITTSLEACSIRMGQPKRRHGSAL